MEYFQTKFIIPSGFLELPLTGEGKNTHTAIRASQIQAFTVLCQLYLVIQENMHQVE